MSIWGITLDYEVKLVRLGSKEMLACRDVQTTEELAKARAAELKAQQQGKAE